MPAAIAVLMNLSNSARFAHRGVDRVKFIELRGQDGGLVLVTGPGRSMAEVLALVKAARWRRYRRTSSTEFSIYKDCFTRL
jgi:hypothetical protein